MFSALRGVSVVGAVGAGALMRASAQCAEEYPPTGLSESVRALPQWIQLGCGDAPYNCAEKGATFAPDGMPPADMPDLSKHNNFMTEVLTPEMYNKLKMRATASGATLAEIIKTGVEHVDQDLVGKWSRHHITVSRTIVFRWPGCLLF